MVATVGWTALKAFILVNLLLGGFAYLLLFERKLLGWMQYRVGPNKTGPWGLLQPIADGVKMMFKEDLIPRDADRLVFLLAPTISVFVALGAFVVIPIAPGWAMAPDVDAGLLVVLAIGSLGVYGIALGGWASQSKYALLGSLRSSAQMISYELAMGMAVLTVFVWAESTRFDAIVASQAGLWNIIRMPLGFLLFLTAMLAETNRAPFDLPEAESELVAGYHTEYSGMRFALFAIAEYVHMITASALITLLYLGGWRGPGPEWLAPIWTLVKMAVLLFFFVWVRASTPRLRYDRLMTFGWKIMLPAAALNLLAYAAVAALT